MSPRISRLALAMSASGVLAGAPLLVACGSSSSGATYDQWAATDGAAGRINLGRRATGIPGVQQRNRVRTPGERDLRRRRHHPDPGPTGRRPSDPGRLGRSGRQQPNRRRGGRPALRDHQRGRPARTAGLPRQFLLSQSLRRWRLSLHLPADKQPEPGTVLLPDNSGPGDRHQAGPDFVSRLQPLRHPVGTATGSTPPGSRPSPALGTRRRVGA